MSIFPLFTTYAWIGQGFHSVKQILNHGHSIYGVDWGAQHSCGEISHGNSNEVHQVKPTHGKPSCIQQLCKDNTLSHGLTLSEDEWGEFKRETTKHGPSQMEVDWGGQIMTNHTSSGCMLMQLD